MRDTLGIKYRRDTRLRKHQYIKDKFRTLASHQNVSASWSFDYTMRVFI